MLLNRASSEDEESDSRSSFSTLLGSGPGGASGGPADADRVVAMLCDLLDGAHDHFDAAVFLACNQYVERHEVEERMTKQVLKEEPIDADDWSVMTFGERVTSAFEEPMRTGYGKTVLGVQILIVLFSVCSVIMETLNAYDAEIWPNQRAQWLAIESIIAL